MVGYDRQPGSAGIGPADGRQTVVEGSFRSGQAKLIPSQVSATSHSPLSARQTTPAGSGGFPGQMTLEPSQ